MPRDDSLMSRFDRQGLRRFRARDAVLAVSLVSALLILFAGASVRRAGEQMSPGIGRDLVLAVGRPAGWLADRLPLQHAAHRATAWLSPDQSLGGGGGFTAAAASGSGVPRSPRTPSTRRRLAAARRPSGGCTRCWSPATRCRSRWTTTSPARSPARP